MGIFSKLFRAPQQAVAPRRPDPYDIIGAFGTLLESAGAPVMGMTVADESELPYAKVEIKRALLAVLGEVDSPQFREHLKTAYLHLASYQAGVGPVHQGLDMTKVDHSRSAQQIAQDMVSMGGQLEKWKPVIEAEEKALIAELQGLGYWP